MNGKARGTYRVPPRTGVQWKRRAVGLGCPTVRRHCARRVGLYLVESVFSEAHGSLFVRLHYAGLVQYPRVDEADKTVLISHMVVVLPRNIVGER